MLLRHATTSPLGLLFTAFEIASLLSSYIPLQVKWCSTRAERKKGEETGGQKEQRPRQGRRGLGEGEGQGQRGHRGPNRRQGKEGRRTHGANQGQRQGQARQGQGPAQVVALVVRRLDGVRGGPGSWLSALQLVMPTHPGS